MSKYLLLRNNKQSGPFTVPEIIAKGIKPYDLVWLEGKSAAWRYPSEIEELKAYAPAVEEQPFDRFYKKPEPQKETGDQPERKSRFEPVVAEETVRKKIDPALKKVYINFPGGPKKVPAYQEPKTPLPEIMPALQYTEPLTVRPENRPASDKKYMYAGIAACFILVGIICLLLVNYSSQQTHIRQLNDILDRLEKKQAEGNRLSQGARIFPAASLPSSTPKPYQEPAGPAPDILRSPAVAHKITRENPATRHVTAPEAPLNQTKSVIKEQQEALAAQMKVAAPQPREAIKENLFNLVSVKSNKYKTGVLGGISNLRLELTNNSLRTLQKVAVEVRYLSPEKKVVKTQTVYFEKVSPGGQPALDVPKSNRGVTIDYTITDIKSY